MSTSNIRMLISKIPKASLKGIAYLAAANFLARAVILIRNYIANYFHSEMILIYGATLDTRILLFFQSIYMIPMFLLGVLVFYGIERESFNLTLYPTLMLLFLILIRYGSESALLVMHWDEHKFNQTPDLLFTLLLDIIFIALLLLYVYVHLAFTSIKPTPMELVEGGRGQSTSHNHADAQGFNYAIRRNVDHKADEGQRNSLIKEREAAAGTGSVIETDLDAPAPAPVAVALPIITESPPQAPAPIEEQPQPQPKPKMLKKRAYLQKKLSQEAASPPPADPEPEPEPQPEPEKPAGNDADFWSTMNSEETEGAKTDSFKTTSV